MKEEQIKIEPIFELPIEKENPYGEDVLEDLNVLLSCCVKNLEKPNLEKITRAFYFSVDAHKGVFRESGEPYYTHPLKVALFLMKDFSIYDEVSVIAALLHDAIEDVDSVTMKEIEEKFGAGAAKIVDGVTKIKDAEVRKNKDVSEKTKQLEKAATYGKLFMALVKDIRVILVKLADRLDNMRTLRHVKKRKQKVIARETLNFYTPFAQRLGFAKIKKYFEDLSLYYIDQKAFNVIHRALIDKRKTFINYIKSFLAQINQKLNEKSIPHVLTIEHKHVFEIYKMIEQGKSLDDIDNFYSMVVTLKTNDFTEAYRAYGIIANIFGPVSSLEDYIARPKINLYRALHSTHFGPGSKLIEVIIRTEQMDEIVDKGIVGYYSLSKAAKPLEFNQKHLAEWIDWMKDLIRKGETDAIQKIWGSIKKNLYDDEITVHIKEGKSYELPKGACPIDLAFDIDEKTAYKLISAKINNEIKSLNYELQNNDYVELIYSPQNQPNPEWQNYVITSKAVVSLYNYFKGDNYHYIREKQSENGFKILIKAEERPKIIKDIRGEIGPENIRRMFFYAENAQIESLVHLSSRDDDSFNALFTRLLSVKGIRGVEKIDE